MKAIRKTGWLMIATLLSVASFGVVSLTSKIDESAIKASASSTIDTYYSRANGKGSTLLSYVNTIINDGYDNPSYDGLKTLYTQAYVRADGYLWDIYSDSTHFTPGSGFGSSGTVGGAYNREHSIPKSWWGGAETKQGSDGFIVVPSDAAINGHRSNYPYGETTTGTKKQGDTSNGNRLGDSTSTEYISGKVFEPMDDRKGDIARIYFYAVAMFLNGGAGNGKVTNWTSGNGNDVFSASGNNGFVSKYADMLIKWHNQDPVSEREIAMNDAVYGYQKNRNPFIDHPSWVDLIWGGVYSTSNKNAENTNGGTASVVNGSLGGYIDDSDVRVTVSPSSASVAVDSSTQLSATLVGATGSISWSQSSTNGGEVILSSTTGNAVTVIGKTAGTVVVTASYGNIASGSAIITVTESGQGGGGGDSGESGDEITLAIPFTGSVSRTTDSEGNYWNVDGDYVVGSSYLQIKSSTTYIYNEAPLSIDTSNTVAVKAKLRTYGGANNQSLKITAYNEQGTAISNTLTLSPTSSSLADYSGTLTFTSSTYHSVNFKAYGGNNSSLGISGLELKYTSYSSGDPAPTVSSIQITNAPTKLTYIEGEYFDPTGLLIKATYSDDSKATIEYALHSSDFSFEPSLTTQLATSNISVTITYGGASESQAITVNAVALQSITLSNITSSYYVGDAFVAPTVTANRNNGNNTVVTSGVNITGYNMNQPGTQEVTVSYTENGVTKTAKYNITVTEIAISSLELSNKKTAYFVGDTFVKPTVTAHYNNGDTADVTSGATFTGYNMANAGNQTVTVSYSDKSTTYQITVTAVVVDSLSISNQKTSYNIGDTFVKPTVTAHYNNGTTNDVTSLATFTGYDMNNAGSQTVVVSFGGKSTSYSIKVIDPSSPNPTIDIYVPGTVTYNSYSGVLTEGDYVIIYDNSAMKNTVSSSRLSYSGVTISNNKVTSTVTDDILWHIAPNGDYWTIYNQSSKEYAVGTGTKNQANLSSDGSTNYAKWSVSSTSSSTTYDFVNKGNTDDSVNATLRKNGTYGFACYATNIGGALSLYKKNDTGGQTIEVEVTRITASSTVSTYHPGENFDASKVTVTAYYEDGNTEKSVELTNEYSIDGNNYMFTYDDARNGTKSFNVSLGGLSTLVSFNVTRVNYQAPADSTVSLTGTDFVSINGGSSDLKSGTLTVDGITYEYNKAYYYSQASDLEFGKGNAVAGYLRNQTPFASPMTNVSVTEKSGQSNLKVSTDGVNWVLKANANFETTNYYYFKVDFEGKNVTNYTGISAVSVSLKGMNTPTNVANYIMYEDTNNQCTTKLDIAIGYLNMMTNSDKQTFMTSNDYVIKTARERINAWCVNQGKTLSLTNNSFVASSVNLPLVENNSMLVLVSIISIISISSISIYLISKKKRLKEK